MTADKNSKKRDDYCPVYDIECPSGSEAADSCKMRFETDYNPLTNFRDADIEHCAIYRKEQAALPSSNNSSIKHSSENGA